LVTDGALHEVAAAPLRAWEAIDREIEPALGPAQDDTERRLMTGPGVGVLVALTYGSGIADRAQALPVGRMIRRHLHQKLPRTQRACAGGLPPSHGICVETDAESRAEPLIITRRYS
jgi:hypothetical protein